MSVYMQQGNTVNISADGAFQIYEQLPPAVYNIQLVPMQPPALVQREPLPMPSKVYGDIEGISEHIMTAFEQRPANTGVLLSGMKGSGKTLIARNISNRLLEKGIPTIVISPTQIGPATISFLQLITSPCMLLFDEIDKIPGDKDDARTATDCMLGFLDGLCIGKKLSVLTVNSGERVNPNFLDRPGRLLYHYKFDGINVDTAKSFCLDRLDDKSQWKAFERIVQLSRNVSFDMLQALVEECNRFKCTPMQALSVLNVTPTISGRFNCRVLSTSGKRVFYNKYDTHDLNFEHNPWWAHICFYVEISNEDIEKYKLEDEHDVRDEVGNYGDKTPAAPGFRWVEFCATINCCDYDTIENGVVRYTPKDVADIVIEFYPYVAAYSPMEWD